MLETARYQRLFVWSSIHLQGPLGANFFNRIEEKGEVRMLYFKILYLFYLKTALSDLVLLCTTWKKASHYSQGLW